MSKLSFVDIWMRHSAFASVSCFLIPPPPHPLFSTRCWMCVHALTGWKSFLDELSESELERIGELLSRTLSRMTLGTRPPDEPDLRLLLAAMNTAQPRSATQTRILRLLMNADRHVRPPNSSPFAMSTPRSFASRIAGLPTPGTSFSPSCEPSSSSRTWRGDRPGWDHPDSDPLQDIRDFTTWAKEHWR